jgi:NAD(P)-dependent dehydrogenase (short-subunit alcohol dehydrogenase family)
MNDVEKSAGGRLRSKAAIVTGAGRGIGRTTALRMAAEGAAVIAVDLEGAAATAAEVEAAGGRAAAVDGSVAERATWTQARDLALERFSAIDCLANVAGITLPQRNRPDNAVELADDDLSLLLDVNLRGPLLGIQAILPAMVEAGSGVIVNVTSGAAIVGIANHAGYSATKGGLRMLTRQLAVEYGPAGVRAVSVAPGAIDTPMNAATPAEIRAAIAADTPLGRMGRPDDVAAVIAFLASDEAAFITGTEVVVDGGITAR